MFNQLKKKYMLMSNIIGNATASCQRGYLFEVSIHASYVKLGTVNYKAFN